MKTTRIGIAALSMLAAGSLQALNINLVYDPDPSAPAVDLNGARLMAIAQAAATYWEDIIEDNHNVTFTIGYTNLNPPTIGQWNETNEAGGRATAGTIVFDAGTVWFYDPTPTDHSEYNLQQTIFRNQPANDLANFGGSPPQVLETYFSGPALGSAPLVAQQNTDLLTVMLHEMGHGLGMSNQLSTCAQELNDGDFDLFSSQLNGAVMSMGITGNSGAHVGCAQCLMNPTIPAGARVLPSAAEILALATSPSPGWTNLDLDRQDFLPGGTTDWNTSGNWVGNAVPGSLDDASVRHGIDVQGNVTVGLSSNAWCRNFLLSSATSMRTNSSRLAVGDSSRVIFDGNLPVPQVRVESGGELRSNDLLLQGATVSMESGYLQLFGDLTIDAETLGQTSRLIGQGTIDVGGTLDNEGLISATTGGNLVFTSTNNNQFDLDGSNGDGEVLATTGSIRFMGAGTTDDVNSRMQVNPGNDITIDGPWSLGGGGLIRLIGGANTYAELKGGFFVANDGDLQCSGRTRINNTVQLGGNFECAIATGGRLDMTGAADLNGGSFALAGQDSLLFGTQPVEITGTDFTLGNGSLISFINDVTIDGGSFTGGGVLAMTGPITTIESPLSIDTAVVKLDAFNDPAKKLIINHELTINSPAIDLGNNSFDSTLEMNGDDARLIMNGPSEWTMAGTMNQNFGPSFLYPTIQGAPFTMSGNTNIDGVTRWVPRVRVTGNITLSDTGDKLRLSGGGDALDPNRIEGGSITGSGKLLVEDNHLVGFGGISVELDFHQPGSFLAKDGTLSFFGSFTDMPGLLGTVNDTARLNITQDWTLPGTSLLEMNGGFVQGGAITANGPIRGHGDLRPQNLISNNSIEAEGDDTLVIDTTVNPDLDGTGSAQDQQGRLLEAVNGSIIVTRPLTDSFGGTANVTTGRSLEFLGGWTLDPTGTLNMADGTLSNPAVLGGSTAILGGAVNVAGTVRFDAPATFLAGSSTLVFDGNTTLSLAGNTVIENGALFGGAGKLLATGNSSLRLADGASVDVPILNANAVMEVGNSPGTATVAQYTQAFGGGLTVEIAGLPNSSDYDQLIVTGEANLGGTLSVDFSAAGAQAGDTWKILSAGSIVGTFTFFEFTGTPAGTILQKFETSDGVYVKLATKLSYEKWALNNGLDNTNNGIEKDPDGDRITNGLEMFMGLDPLSPEPGQGPAMAISNVGGTDYLAITVPLATDYNPGDLELTAKRSTDLQNWFPWQVVLETEEFLPLDCLVNRTYRSEIPLGDLPEEFLRIEVNPIGP